MSHKNAESLGIKNEALRRCLLRMDSAKLNIAPPATAATWFKLVSVPLGNPTPRYPNGDHVHTVEPWTPPNFLTVELANQILDRLDEGPEPGRRYSPSARATDRNPVPAILEIADTLTETQARSLLTDWLKNACLISRDYDDPRDRKSRKGIFIGTRPGSSFDG